MSPILHTRPLCVLSFRLDVCFFLHISHLFLDFPYSQCAVFG